MSKSDNSLRSPLGRVRGLGSAKDGVSHWWLQRVTALALIPCVVILALVLLRLGTHDHAAVRAAFQNPLLATLALLAILAMFWHIKLGLQVVIEDYFHTERTKILVLLVMTFVVFGVGALGALSVLKLFFGA